MDFLPVSTFPNAGIGTCLALQADALNFQSCFRKPMYRANFTSSWTSYVDFHFCHYLSEYLGSHKLMVQTWGQFPSYQMPTTNHVLSLMFCAMSYFHDISLPQSTHRTKKPTYSLDFFSLPRDYNLVTSRYAVIEQVWRKVPALRFSSIHSFQISTRFHSSEVNPVFLHLRVFHCINTVD